MNLVLVERTELSVGKPLPWTIYDQNQIPLMQRGAFVSTEKQMESLMACKPLRELVFDMDLADVKPGSNEASSGNSSARLSGPEESHLRFQDLNLKVGDRLQLEPPVQLGTERSIVKLLGYLENTSLLVTAPFENGTYLPLLEGEVVVIRGFSRRNAFGFSSTVRRVCKLPFGYLHLSFPDEVQGTVIRKSPRVKTKIITTVTKPDAGEAVPQTGTIVNISSTGAQLAARKFLGEVGETVKLAFRVSLHNMDAYLTACGIIRRVFTDEDEKGDASQVSYGVEFCGLQSNDRLILQSLIYQQMIEFPQSLV
ncbi:MAG: flagellar brake protein [Nitrosomonadales bacterium]|nr:flagellar brake protein [Nitrosomonadales bacterium]